MRGLPFGRSNFELSRSAFDFRFEWRWLRKSSINRKSSAAREIVAEVSVLSFQILPEALSSIVKAKRRCKKVSDSWKKRILTLYYYFFIDFGILLTPGWNFAKLIFQFSITLRIESYFVPELFTINNQFSQHISLLQHSIISLCSLIIVMQFILVAIEKSITRSPEKNLRQHQTFSFPCTIFIALSTRSEKPPLYNRSLRHPHEFQFHRPRQCIFVSPFPRNGNLLQPCSAVTSSTW